VNEERKQGEIQEKRLHVESRGICKQTGQWDKDLREGRGDGKGYGGEKVGSRRILNRKRSGKRRANCLGGRHAGSKDHEERRTSLTSEKGKNKIRPCRTVREKTITTGTLGGKEVVGSNCLLLCAGGEGKGSNWSAGTGGGPEGW